VPCFNRTKVDTSYKPMGRGAAVMTFTSQLKGRGFKSRPSNRLERISRLKEAGPFSKTRFTTAISHPTGQILSRLNLRTGVNPAANYFHLNLRLSLNLIGFNAANVFRLSATEPFCQ